MDALWPVAVVTIDRVSFADLYRAEYVRMVRVAWLLVGSQATAEDLVQDSFVRIAGRYDSIDRPPAYLRATVVNACRNELRRTRRLSSRPVTDTPVLQPEMSELFDGLSGLRHKHRAAIVLRYVDDLSDEDIARVLGVRRATVRSMVHRGLAQLREAIDDT